MRGRLTGTIALPMLPLPVLRCARTLTRCARARPLPAKAIVTVLLTLRRARGAMATWTLAGAVPVGFAAGLPHREFGFLALGNMPFRTWQRGADQSAMHRPFVVWPIVVDHIAISRFGRSGREGAAVIRRRRQ